METKRDIRYDEEYIKLKKAKRKLRRSNQRLARFALFLMGVICVLLAVIIIGGATLVARNKILKSDIASLENTIASSDTYNLDLTEKFNTLSDNYKDTAQIATSLDEQNKELVKQINELNSTLNQYESREELFDEYEYAIIRDNGTRTDIFYENINNLKSLADDLGMSDDGVNLILSVAMTETRGTENATNPESSALGLGQILNDTGKFVWTKLMKNSSYDHKSIALDADKNLTMMAYYIDYLNDKYNGDARLAIKEYRGEDDKPYFKKVDKYLAENNLSLDTVKVSK